MRSDSQPPNGFANSTTTRTQRVREQEGSTPRAGLARASFDGVRERQVVGGVRHRDDAERLHHRQPVREQRRDERRPDARRPSVPPAVSWMPRRRNQPTMQKTTLPTNGMRQPHAATCSGLSSALTSHADPEPRMNPIVVPAAVELLTRPRIDGDGRLGRVDHRAGELAAEREALDQSHRARAAAARPRRSARRSAAGR